jgi:ketosteroid isomerase-like protein
MFLGAAAGLALVPAAARAASPAQATELKQRIIEWYRAFGNPRVDRTYYRSFMTDDYWLLENGELLNVAGDMALLGSLPADHVRTDKFDFRHIWVDGDLAYLVYFLDSEMNDSKNGRRSRRYLESAVLRHIGGQWRAAVLHSTKINPPKS